MTGIAKRSVDRWNAYWFPPSTTLHLAICRIVAVAAQLLWFPPPLGENLNLIRKNTEFVDPQVLIRAIAAVVPRDVFFTTSTFTGLYWLMIVSGIAALIGLFTRVSLFVLALTVWIFVAHLYSYADVHHEATLFGIFLMSLAFAPSGDRLSVDALNRRRTRGQNSSSGRGLTDMAMWPLKLAHVLLALTYFSTGISKLAVGGLRWMNGYTLQDYTLNDAVSRGIPLGIWLGQQHGLAVLLSIYTVVFELTFFLSLFFPRTAPFFFLGGLFFQIGLYLTAGHDFFPHMVLLVLLLLFLTPEPWEIWWPKFFDRIRSRFGRRAPVHQPL
jgi:uncharacterized membrane protein YphA (DoxX/SURF4 family)